MLASLPFNAEIQGVGPKADFQYWSTNFDDTAAGFVPTPVLHLPRGYHRRKFWWGVNMRDSTLRFSAMVNFEWVFKGPLHEKRFKVQWFTEFKSERAWVMEGATHGLPHNVAGGFHAHARTEAYQEPIQFRSKFGGTAFRMSTFPNFFLGEYDTLEFVPGHNANGVIPTGNNTGFGGTADLAVFVGVYSEQIIDPR